MNNVLQMVWLIPVLPLIGFLINGLGRNNLSKTLSGVIGSGVILASFLISVYAFFIVKGANPANPILPVHYFDFII